MFRLVNFVAGPVMFARPPVIFPPSAVLLVFNMPLLAVLLRSMPAIFGGSSGSSPGETIRFAARNPTQAARELAVGPAEELKAHAEMVRKHPGMQGGKGSRVSVKAGGSAVLVWKAAKAGRFAIACGAPGQFDASGTGQVIVGAR